jgi:hypothetical protein
MSADLYAASRTRHRAIGTGMEALGGIASIVRRWGAPS